MTQTVDSSRTIKKYPNRRLYDTETSTYITLADVKQLVLDNVGFKVVDAKSNEDITRSILLQIILELESEGVPMFNANMLFSFSSGRPYTPMDQWNLLGDNGINSTTKGYINSAFAPGSFRIDLKMEKSFAIGDIFISPYIWIENLLDADNITGVYRSTGSPYTTGYLTTPGGMATSELQGEGFVQDYKSLENNPANFGIPRLIKLGFKLNFSNISL